MLYSIYINLTYDEGVGMHRRNQSDDIYDEELYKELIEERENTELQAAIKCGRINYVKQNIDSIKNDPNSTHHIIDALEYGQLELVKYLIDQRIKIPTEREILKWSKPLSAL